MASRRKNRRNIAFNLAFLDVMSCGFGAAVLLFLIIKHGVEQDVTDGMESARLHQDIAARQAEIESINNEISAMKQQAFDSDALLSQLGKEIASTGAKSDAVKAATVQLSGKIEDEKKALAATEAEADKKQKAARVAVKGEARQQFLTGLAVEGRNIVIMVDHSASMLDEKIVDIIRRRTIGGEVASKAPKWLRAQRISQWLVNRLPEKSKVRFVSFSEAADLYPETSWLNASDASAVTKALDDSLKMTPNGGTNLYNAFQQLKTMSPVPDAVYLVTDGLPTQGKKKSRSATVSGEKRIKLFEEAVQALPGRDTKMNVILLPLEGDPYAAAAFWHMARTTGGRMLSPSASWP